MPVITVFACSHCDGETIAGRLADALEYEYIDDDRVVAELVERYSISRQKAARALFGKPSVFNRFTRERERTVAMYKAVVAEMLMRDGSVFFGRAGHLVPPTITHVLKVCLIADEAFRIERAKASHRNVASRIARALRADDERDREWTDFVLHHEPWNPSLYDIVIPVNEHSEEETVELILENARKPVVQPTTESIQAVRDFALAARVGVVLSEEGHDVDIDVQGGVVTLTINKHVIMLSRLEAELKRIAGGVEGVQEVVTRVGPDFYRSDIYRQQDFSTPGKVLLVDDEREFAQTLSERLLMRDVGSAVAYDGEEALSLIDDDEPEVMVLDLKMPGIDGIEVLRRVKRDHPDVEVIILTGHGSEEDEKVCRQLGAFEYLRKPVDIDALSDAMQAAYERIRSRRKASNGD